MKLSLSIFSRAPVAQFAKSLAEDIGRRYPPAIDKDPAKRPSVNRLTRIIEDACAKAAEFRATHGLGWLAKAKLANTFRWELAEMGYRQDFIDFATEAIVIHVSRKPAA